ncbi:MAG: hypothetical protein JNJ77_05920 [Planctomycetia bacterium]|nr:hypothetical protein [Planctomycetia bacterium]
MLRSEDVFLVNRIVGTLEYFSALRNFDEFLRTANREELDAADRYVSNRPEFTVYSQLSDRFRQQPVMANATSRESAAKKQGLMWVVALARLEAGGILGTFSTISNPFEVVEPTLWEMPAYRELLMDGAQTHFWALANDPNVAAVAMKIPGTEMLSYIRRLNLARSMLSAAARSNADQLTPVDWSELTAQDSKLLGMRNQFSFRVKRYMASQTSSTRETTTRTKQSTLSDACILQLAGEQRELAAGTLRTETFHHQKGDFGPGANWTDVMKRYRK